MTAPTINGARYPQPVDALLPQALQLADELGAMPSRNRLMREFRIGAPKADELRDRLAAEWVQPVNAGNVIRAAVEQAEATGVLPTADDLAAGYGLKSHMADLAAKLTRIAVDRRAAGLPTALDDPAWPDRSPAGPIAAPLEDTDPVTDPGVRPDPADPWEHAEPVEDRPAPPVAAAPYGPDPAPVVDEHERMRQRVYREVERVRQEGRLTGFGLHPDRPSEPAEVTSDTRVRPAPVTVPATPDPVVAADEEPQPTEVGHPGTKITVGPVRRVVVWPVVLMALGAFVAVWSGWVGLGKLTGFGKVDLLPGIVDPGSWATIDSAITLPIGVEAYAAYALYVWLSGHVPTRARTFAKRSALASLAVGALGQVAYHLLTAYGVTAAPWWITTLVSCLPVAVLGMGAALAHLVRDSSPR